MKKFIKKIISNISKNIIYFPIYEKFVIKYCQIGVNKKNIFSKFINILFWSEYYHRSLPHRINIQSKLMGGEIGAIWAREYNKSRKIFPPLKGNIKVGNLDWHDVNLGFAILKDLIIKDCRNICLIQLGASSGKEISYLAKNFSEAEFIYTDIFEETTSYAKSQFLNSNLKYVTCPAESIPALVEISNKKKLIIYSSGSAQYVFPENLEFTFKLFSKVQNKEINIIFDEPGNCSNINPKTLKGSYPRGNFSYTHNYRYYAEKYGFQTLRWNIIQPFLPQEEFFPHHQGTVQLCGWFVKK